MTTTALFCFNRNYVGLRRGFWEHAALAYLVGDDFSRLPGGRADQPGSAPKLYTVMLGKNLRLGDSLFIVGAHKRFIPVEMAVITYRVSAILWHYRGACRPGGRQPFTYAGSRLRLPGASDKSIAVDSWMGTFCLFPEALRFFD
jgi:hypothetical protein